MQSKSIVYPQDPKINRKNKFVARAPSANFSWPQNKRQIMPDDDGSGCVAVKCVNGKKCNM